MLLRICCTITVLTAIITTTAAGAVASQSRCSSRPIYYASECLEMKECAWCCEKPVGQQCFDKLRSASSALACAEYAIVNDTNTRCGDLCAVTHGDCESCQERNWCYFCISSSMCQPPYASCSSGQVIQLCSMQNIERNEMHYFMIVMGVGGALIMLSMFGGLVLLSLHVRQRRREDEQPLLEDERTPFLHDARAADAVSPRTVGDPTINSNIDANITADEFPPGTASSGACSHGETRPEAAVESSAVHDTREGEAAEVHLPTPRSAKVSTGDDDSICFLCLDANPSVTFLPCYHTCCCEACSNKLRPTRGDVLTCPFCRAKIEAMVSLHSVLMQARLL
ncbi:hypothetical protein TraAM80_05021 [Trypanosoma rangeli]|uniref:RING-type domain-containing protein n=1 Tax=Trypanosoma rangeli TaxID=5698 RepID=A0A3R7KMH8_TRYRA|nr:uncharacterized protein TraAM80_05021 [Trypanosoma rangeli]RNF04618.1 hypothetical protein TraAM80_05021 [Trypanosoma rangeli]|eukprot:RNF04618.1 hypothetical protein TraAM80_05021 [Trypanosoma rangeli]